MDLKKYIPFEKKEFRPHQEQAIKDIIESIESGNQYTILHGVVGGGKSLIGYVVAKYFEEQGLETYMATGTKILQSQYINDFQDVKTIKGRSNFMCKTEPLFSCSEGMCQSGYKDCLFKPKIDNGIIYYNDEEITNNDYLDNSMCEYWYQKSSGILSPLTMLNYDYLITDRRYTKQLPYRYLFIGDESHQIENVLMRQLEVQFSPRVIQKEINYKVEEQKNIEDWIEVIEDISLRYKKLLNNTKNKDDRIKYNQKYLKFNSLSKDLISDLDNWVFIKESIGNRKIYSFKPVVISKYTDYIFGIAQHSLIMTGTILKQDIFARDLGIDDFTYIELPSMIPSKNRPIIKSYVGPMSKRHIGETMPKMIDKINFLADKHKGEKGLIHCYTYAISKLLKDGLSSDRFMFHNSKNKEQIFNEFKASTEDKVLVSPVAYEGVDFPDDEARFQLLIKDPFPNIFDKQIAMRDVIDYDYVFRQRCLVLSQSYGRLIRSPTDWGVTYLLDSRIETLLGDKTLVTDYFLEGLQGYNYETKLELCENAYEKLTPDNSRANHERDRMIEKQLLDDIQEGYDTLGILRREYKKFPSDAYKEITPAIKRLLKHNAIRYKE